VIVRTLGRRVRGQGRHARQRQGERAAERCDAARSAGRRAGVRENQRPPILRHGCGSGSAWSNTCQVTEIDPASAAGRSLKMVVVFVGSSTRGPIICRARSWHLGRNLGSLPSIPLGTGACLAHSATVRALTSDTSHDDCSAVECPRLETACHRLFHGGERWPA
jgi:hypothetical protein